MKQSDEIKERLDIVAVIGDSIALQKSGRNFKANCPFHQEKTPSFFVFPDGQNWRCFGACATGGDIFSFVMKRDNATFTESLRMLAEKAGITLHNVKQESDEEKRSREKLLLANKEAAAFFVERLASDRGGPARSYLAGRNLTDPTIASFQLGYAPDSWDALGQHLHDLGFTTADLIGAGLQIEGERGTYDRFRHKVMFPITDRKGSVIGFGSRVLDDSIPKYINSPQTAIFDKSATLYGLDKANESIRKENLAVLVEGYFDAIMAHQHGFANVIATLGTALSDKHVNSLKRLTKRIALSLDGDQAGVNAMLRGYEVAKEAFDQKAQPVTTARGLIRYQTVADAEIQVITLPWGKDPDDIIHQDPNEWRKLVYDAQPVIDFIFGAVFDANDTREPAGKRAIVDALAPVINDIPDPVTRGHYVQRLARGVQIGERELGAYIGTRRSGRRQATQPAQAPVEIRRRDQIEEHFLALILRYRQLRSAGQAAEPELFEHAENRAIFEAWRAIDEPAELHEDDLDDEVREQFGIILSTSVPPLESAELELDLRNTLRRLQERSQRKHYEGLASVLSELESSVSADAMATRAYEALQGESSDLPEQLRQAVELQEQAVTNRGRLQSLFHERSGSKPSPE